MSDLSGGDAAGPVIETTGLRKEFRGRRGGLRVAVDDLDLAVPAGGVHGFLGPNGSGKTTTIRMLLGLARATSGEMRLFGESVPRRLPEVIDRVGAVVEAPKFSPHLSGRRNLMLLAGIIGVPATRVDEAVETVGLTGRDGDRFKAYSLGMKQRLAIAATLLKGPDLLILDEPTEGIQPNVVAEIESVIIELTRRGDLSVLLVEQHVGFALRATQHYYVLESGRITSSGEGGPAAVDAVRAAMAV